MAHKALTALLVLVLNFHLQAIMLGGENSNSQCGDILPPSLQVAAWLNSGLGP